MANINFYTSPRGRASYPKLTVPDTKFNAEGIYQTKLVVAAEDAQEFIEQIKEAAAAELGPKKAAALQQPYAVDENGDYVFTFKSKKKPALFNAAGKPILAKNLKIGSGSVMKVKGAIGPVTVQGKHWATLWMSAVQILDLVEFQSGAGFGADNSGSFTGGDEADEAEEANSAVAGAKADAEAEDF